MHRWYVDVFPSPPKVLAVNFLARTRAYGRVIGFSIPSTRRVSSILPARAFALLATEHDSEYD